MAQNNRGQSKTFQVTKTDPITGEVVDVRTVTQQEWKDQKLGQQGYTKPEDAEEPAEEPEGES